MFFQKNSPFAIVLLLYEPFYARVINLIANLFTACKVKYSTFYLIF